MSGSSSYQPFRRDQAVVLIVTRSVSEGFNAVNSLVNIPRRRFLKLRFLRNPLRQRGIIDIDSSLTYAAGY
ncbi:hypothetical protein Pla100_49860 [Neorhodopirellula pilleata]|uniref:Uncharacterized protein n=1 Tax=Neorhodopirellula pilleata TaxID=2714738 RepID=A0A5C5ZWU4_9BACT|nr:hypothetical protein Pla100_49860 [Neorhodopirellula pilleata]